MKIVINHSKHLLVHGGRTLLPGTNVVADFDASHPVMSAMVESGEVEIFANPTSAQRKCAVENAASDGVLAALEKHFRVPKAETSGRRAVIGEVSRAVDEELAREAKGK